MEEIIKNSKNGLKQTTNNMPPVGRGNVVKEIAPTASMTVRIADKLGRLMK